MIAIDAAQDSDPFLWEAFDLLGVPMPQSVEYRFQLRQRYHFERLWSINWVQLNKDDVEQNDLWSMSLPPKVDCPSSLV
jgi:hypothetical protein